MSFCMITHDRLVEKKWERQTWRRSLACRVGLRYRACSPMVEPQACEVEQERGACRLDQRGRFQKAGLANPADSNLKNRHCRDLIRRPVTRQPAGGVNLPATPARLTESQVQRRIERA